MRLGPPPPHLHRDWVHPSHICTGTGPTLPHLHRDWAHPSHICTGTWLTPAHICAGTGLTPATSAHLHRGWGRSIGGTLLRLLDVSSWDYWSFEHVQTFDSFEDLVLNIMAPSEHLPPPPPPPSPPPPRPPLFCPPSTHAYTHTPNCAHARSGQAAQACRPPRDQRGHARVDEDDEGSPADPCTSFGRSPLPRRAVRSVRQPAVSTPCGAGRSASQAAWSRKIFADFARIADAAGFAHECARGVAARSHLGSLRSGPLPLSRFLRRTATSRGPFPLSPFPLISSHLHSRPAGSIPLQTFSTYDFDALETS